MVDNNVGGSCSNYNENGGIIKEQDRLLPIANVGRIMKQILPQNAKISKESKETMQECVSEFISFVTSEASEKCRKERRKTVNGDDICWALATLGFDDYAERMRRLLQQSEESGGGREGTAMEKKTTPYLPSELIIEILLRLPVKSLIRFKSVCKSWFIIISNPNFANSHFHSSSEAQTRRILSISAIPHQIRSIDFEALLNNHSTSPNPNLSLPQSYFPLNIEGSCRGFIFLNCSSNYYIWNPSTGFCKKILLSPFDRYLYGFGYDHSRDDYMVVSLSNDDNSSHLKIFSLRDDKWKEIEDPPFRYMSAYNCPKVGFFFNGAIHWFVFRCYSLVIIAFDLMERKLLEMLLPFGFANHYPTEFDLWVYGEFLSIWALRKGIVEIWEMKEYKVASSWTKTLVFPIDAIPYFSPIYSTKNGDIIGTIGGTGLVKYNGKGQLLGHFSYCDDPRGSQVVMYTESLLSLPGDNKQVYEDDTNKKNEVLKYSPTPFS